jgi:hypothetical protein
VRSSLLTQAERGGWEIRDEIKPSLVGTPASAQSSQEDFPLERYKAEAAGTKRKLQATTGPFPHTHTTYTTPSHSIKMACIASSFAGSVAALKATKVQVSVHSPPPSRANTRDRPGFCLFVFFGPSSREKTNKYRGRTARELRAAAPLFLARRATRTSTSIVCVRTFSSLGGAAFVSPRLRLPVFSSERLSPRNCQNLRSVPHQKKLSREAPTDENTPLSLSPLHCT